MEWIVLIAFLFLLLMFLAVAEYARETRRQLERYIKCSFEKNPEMFRSNVIVAIKGEINRNPSIARAILKAGYNGLDSKKHY